MHIVGKVNANTNPASFAYSTFSLFVSDCKMRFEAAYNYQTYYIEVSEPEESWVFARFSAGYVADCASELVAPVFANNNTEIDMTSDTAIKYNASSGLLMV